MSFSLFLVTKAQMLVWLLAVSTVGIYLHCYVILRNWVEDSTAKNVPTTVSYIAICVAGTRQSVSCSQLSPTINGQFLGRI